MLLQRKKLVELAELKTLIESENYCAEPAYQRNEALFVKKQKLRKSGSKRAPVTCKRYGLCKASCTERTSETAEKEALALPLLPTTTIGSFPQTKDVKANRAAYRKGENIRGIIHRI